MDKLISAEKLYNKITEFEELAKKRVLDTPTTSHAYPRYVAQLNERTALKHMIMDEPAAFDTEKVIEELDKCKQIMLSPASKDCFGEECRENDCMACVCHKAIEIVEKGGVYVWEKLN